MVVGAVGAFLLVSNGSHLIATSLEGSGIRKLVLVNAHGGNYVLSNIVQEANVTERRMSLFPKGREWSRAGKHAELASDGHGDMHAGEIETSILLHAEPDLVWPGYYKDADHDGGERRFLLTLGMKAYTESGVIGFPSYATAEKGKAVLESLVSDFADHLTALGEDV